MGEDLEGQRLGKERKKIRCEGCVVEEGLHYFRRHEEFAFLSRLSLITDFVGFAVRICEILL